MALRLASGGYTLLVKDGGVEVRRDGEPLYFNRRPMFVTMKTAFAVNEFYDRAYDDVAEDGGRIVAGGVLAVPSGPEIVISRARRCRAATIGCPGARSSRPSRSSGCMTRSASSRSRTQRSSARRSGRGFGRVYDGLAGSSG
jgi:hypothetical protein